MTTTDFLVELTTVDCGKCGGTYAINERYHLQKYNTGGSWHCPYCQCSWGFGESQLDRVEKSAKRAQELLERERRIANTLRDERDYAQRRLRATKGVVTITKKRIARGACPCCKSTFTDLKQHMEEKHPGYAGEQK